MQVLGSFVVITTTAGMYELRFELLRPQSKELGELSTESLSPRPSSR